MAKNTLLDLNDYLFAQLERLDDENLSADDLKLEICRAAAITSVGRVVIENARTVLDARKHADSDLGVDTKALPPLLTGDRPL